MKAYLTRQIQHESMIRRKIRKISIIISTKAITH